MRLITACLASAALFATTPAAAQELSALTVSGSLGGVSDYRYRGISLSDEDPAAQAGLTVTHAGGLYAGVFAATTDRAIGTGAEADGEIDLYAGYAREIAPGTALDGGLLYYHFPGAGGAGTDYFEPYASLSHTLGPVTAKAGAAYAWDQAATGDDWLYLYGQLTAAVPTTPLSITARVGHQDFGSLRGDYWEYRLGMTASFGPITAGVSYVDTDLGNVANADAGVLVSVAFTF